MTFETAEFNTIAAWIGVACTLAIYSLLYRENPVYRLFEYIFLGVGAAYGATRLLQDVLITDWWAPLSEGQWWWMIPFLIGLLYFTIYFEKLSWMARMLIGTLMGLAAGLQIQLVAITYFPQIRDSFRPLLPGAVPLYNDLMGRQPPTGEDVLVPSFLADRVSGLEWSMISTVANNWVFLITLVAVMTYFFFSFEHKNRTITSTAKLGRWLLMISFGTMFGSTITARVALAVSRIVFVLETFLQRTFG